MHSSIWTPSFSNTTSTSTPPQLPSQYSNTVLRASVFTAADHPRGATPKLLSYFLLNFIACTSLNKNNRFVVKNGMLQESGKMEC
jgi:hypothetical protein